MHGGRSDFPTPTVRESERTVVMASRTRKVFIFGDLGFEVLYMSALCASPLVVFANRVNTAVVENIPAPSFSTAHIIAFET